MFEDDACVNPSDVVDGRPTDAIITFSESFVRPSVDRPEVMYEGLDYAAAPSFGVMCWGYVPPCASVLLGCDGRGTKFGGGEISSELM